MVQADRLEAELVTVLSRRQFGESEEGNSSPRGESSLATDVQTRQQQLRVRGVSYKGKAVEGVRDMTEMRPGGVRRGPKGKGKRKGKGKAEGNDALRNGDVTGDDDVICDATGGDDVICDATGDFDDIEDGEKNGDQKHVGSDPSPNMGTEGTEGRESKGEKGLLKRKRSASREGGDGCDTSPASVGGERHGEVWFQPLPSLHVVMFSYAQVCLMDVRSYFFAFGRD